MGIFDGDPIESTTSGTSVTQTPSWMQQAIYDVVSQARLASQIPYQAYNESFAANQLDTAANRVAAPNAFQQEAWNQTANQTNTWQPGMQFAQSGLGQIAQAPGGAEAASPFFQQSANMLGQMDYNAPAQAAVDNTGLAQANPYLQNSAQTGVANIQDYMNPHTRAVTDEIANMGARNLQENLLPATADAFTRAGQFGSSRMGEFGSRALRDTQEAVLAQQAKAQQEGYTQALGASQTDLSRYGQLGSTAGQLAGADATRQVGAQQEAINQAMKGAGAYGTLGSNAAQITQGDLTNRQGALTNLANTTRLSQQLGAGDIATLSAAGKEQSQYEQKLLDTAYQQFLEQRAYPQQQINWLGTQLGLGAQYAPQSQTSTQTGVDGYSPSPLSQVGSLLATYQGLTS